MGKLAKVAMVASALWFPQTAGATPPSGTLTGILTISTGASFPCQLEIDIYYSSALNLHLANITLTPGSFVCVDGVTGNIKGPIGPFIVEDQGTTLVFHNVMLDEYAFWPCGGDIVAYWDGMTLEAEPQLLPGTGSPGCVVEMIATY